MKDLFRQQVIDEQGQRLLGTVILFQPMSLRIIIFLLALFIIVVITFLSNATFSRKETVQGYLRPDKGHIRSYSFKDSIVKDIFIEKGQKIFKGTPLMHLSGNTSLSDGEELLDKLTTELLKQLSLEDEGLLQNRNDEQHKIEETEEKLRVTLKYIEIMKAQRNIIAHKMQLLKEQKDKFLQLNKEGYVSSLLIQQQKERYLSVQQEMLSLDSAILGKTFELTHVRHEKAHIPEQYQYKYREIEKNRSILVNKLNEIKNKYDFTLKANEGGTITSILVVKGESVQKDQLLITILPENSSLIAELLIPSKSAGFININDNAYLKVEAFPFQKFGTIESKIFNIDQVLLLPKDARLPITFTEPVYRAHAKLKNNKTIILQSGMKFTSSVILESYTLLEWVLSPFSTTEKV